MLGSTKRDVALAGGGRVTSVTYAATKGASRLVLAHGAGANQLHPFMVRIATGLAERGVEVTTFDFPYMQAGRRLPDPLAKLESCFRDVLADVRSRSGGPLFLGGKSMGGRIASYVAASPVSPDAPPISGLVFLGYPLHPPGKPDNLRSDHFSRIQAPMLFVQGSRDAFGTPEELRVVLTGHGGRADIHAVALGDHSFKVPKRAGQSEGDVFSAVLERVAGFVRDPSPRRDDKGRRGA
jgi:uncharacterized protein